MTKRTVRDVTYYEPNSRAVDVQYSSTPTTVCHHPHRSFVTFPFSFAGSSILAGIPRSLSSPSPSWPMLFHPNPNSPALPFSNLASATV